MIIGVPGEVKAAERRVGLTPTSVRELVAHGQDVLIEQGAGGGIGADDDTYRAAGATVVDDAEAVWADAELIVKVKEPRPRSGPGSGPTTRSSPTCTWRPIPTRPPTWWPPGPRASPTRPSPTTHGRLPAARPHVTRWPGALSIQAGATWALEKAQRRFGASCSAACRAWRSAKVVIIGGGTVGFNAGADGHRPRCPTSSCSTATSRTSMRFAGRDLREPDPRNRVFQQGIDRSRHIVLDADLVDRRRC